MESKNISIILLMVCFCSGDFAAPNRRLLDRKLIFDFVRPFDLVAKYVEKCERSPAEGGASEPTNRPQNSQCLDWSQLLNEVRTHFEQEFLPVRAEIYNRRDLYVVCQLQLEVLKVCKLSAMLLMIEDNRWITLSCVLKITIPQLQVELLFLFEPMCYNAREFGFRWTRIVNAKREILKGGRRLNYLV